MGSIDQVRLALGDGRVIPACPLALDAQRRFDERRQRALFRYYLEAGAGGLAVGVHTTQFAIREPRHGLYQPVLELAAVVLRERRDREVSPLGIGGICGPTSEAIREAALLHDLGYDAGLLSLGALGDASDDELLEHCRAVSEIIPLFGFYLQPAAGGRRLSFDFWRRLAVIPGVVAIKIAPFNRYQTLDVVRAVAEAGRDDVALYTGNDDNILLDLLTPFRFRAGNRLVERRIVGGLLGHWAVWTRKAVTLHAECREMVLADEPVSSDWLRLNVAVTDANAAIFDAAHAYAGCIPGIHEVLRRQGLLETIACLDPNETLSPGQDLEIDRICAAYPDLNDNEFVRSRLDRWLQ
jgi:hypothetical protein